MWQTVLRSRTEPLFEGEREREGGGGDKERAWDARNRNGMACSLKYPDTFWLPQRNRIG